MRKIREIDFKDFNENTPKSVLVMVNNIVCDYCGKKFSRNAKDLNANLKAKKGKQWEGRLYCSVACFNKDVHNFPDWIKHNSEAQKIAQNKPEQKIKNSEGVKRSRRDPVVYNKWLNSLRKVFTEEYKEKQRKILKAKWENDEEYRNKVLNSSKFYTSCHGDFISNFSGTIRYESSYELMFLFLKDLEKKIVKRFDIPIKFDYNNNTRYYIPDFICEDTIYEIKSHAILAKKGDYNIFNKKQEAIKDFIDKSDIYKNYKIIFDEDFKNGELNIREYIYSWLLKDGYIKNNFGGKSLKRNSYYTMNYNNKMFQKAKELYLKWISLK